MKIKLLFILCMFPIIILYSQQQIESTLFAYYPFDGHANDKSGNNRDGEIHGSSYQFVSGVKGEALKFNNQNSGVFTVNDHVKFPNSTLREFTIAHWVKYKSGWRTHYSGSTFSIGDNNIKQFRIVITNEGLIYGLFIMDSGGRVFTKAADISDKKWHHITVSINDKIMRLYMDGKIVSAVNVPSYPDFNNPNIYK